MLIPSGVSSIAGTTWINPSQMQLKVIVLTDHFLRMQPKVALSDPAGKF